MSRIDTTRMYFGKGAVALPLTVALAGGTNYVVGIKKLIWYAPDGVDLTLNLTTNTGAVSFAAIPAMGRLEITDSLDGESLKEDPNDPSVRRWLRFREDLEVSLTGAAGDAFFVFLKLGKFS